MLAFFRRFRRAAARGLAFGLILGWCYLLTAGVVYGIQWATTEDTVDRRLSALADVAAGGAFLLALLALIVALLAYNESIKRPRLALEWRLGDGTQNFVSTAATYIGQVKSVAVHPQSQLHLTLISRNAVSARNPAVKVTVLNGLARLENMSPEWSLGDGGPGGFQSALWDGGANYLVHGSWRRQVPALPLGNSPISPNDATSAALKIEWVADGISSRSLTLTIEIQ